MEASKQKVVQYLDEAHASESALVRVLQSQIAMTPRGTYRTGLETHLNETRNHAARVSRRLKTLDQGSNPFMASSASGKISSVRRSRWARHRLIFCGVPVVRRRCSRTPRTPARLRRWRSPRTRRLSGSPALSAIPRPPSWRRRSVPMRKMLQRILREIPKLTDAVVGADVKGNASYDVTTTGAADVPTLPRRPRRQRARRPRRPSASLVKPARSRGSHRPRVRSRGPWPPKRT